MKKAYLVHVDFVTRVILDEEEVKDENRLSEKVSERLMYKIRNDETLENITEVKEDKEVPYDPEYDD